MTQLQLFGGEVQFCDANGAPYAAGTVWFYVPGTTTPKATYQDVNGLVPNTNPVVLDAAGRARIWGTGQYRQVLEDSSGTLIWDQIVATANTISGPGSSTAGDLVTWGDTLGSELLDSGVTLSALALLATTVGVVALQVFTASGTYIPTVGMLKALVIVTGAGGGGAGTPDSAAGDTRSGGGGAGGGTSISLLTAAQIGNSQVVTVGTKGAGGAAGDNAGGAGGGSSLGTLVTANGGPGGVASAGAGTGVAGPAAGTATSPGSAFPGADGGQGISAIAATVSGAGGLGGSSWWGAGGAGALASSGVGAAGRSSVSPGGGGGGGVSVNAGGTAAGGNGSDGTVWVLEFCAGQTGA